MAAVNLGTLAMTAEWENTPKQRVALFTANFDYNLDGVALTLNRLVSHLLAQGHDVAVFAPSRKVRVIPLPELPPQPEAPGRESDKFETPENFKAPGIFGTLRQIVAPSVSCPIFGEYELTFPTMGKLVRNELKLFNPTVLHIATPDPLGHAAQRWAVRFKIPVVCSFHTRYHRYLHFYALGWTEPAYWWALKKFHKNCAGTYPPSETVADELRAHGIKNVSLWSRGVDTVQFDPARRSDELRREWRKIAAEKSELAAEKRHGRDQFTRTQQFSERKEGTKEGGDGRAARLGFVNKRAMGIVKRTLLGILRRPQKIHLEKTSNGGRWRPFGFVRRKMRRLRPPRFEDDDERIASSSASAAVVAANLENSTLGGDDGNFAAPGDAVPILLLVSRLRWEKGVAGFAAVVRALEMAQVPHVAVIVGDGGARVALQKRLPKAVFTGALSGTELAAAYASADVFVTASTTEGWGGTVLEAMASGLAVAAYAASGISQLLVPDFSEAVPDFSGSAPDFSDSPKNPGEVRVPHPERSLSGKKGSQSGIRELLAAGRAGLLATPRDLPALAAHAGFFLLFFSSLLPMCMVRWIISQNKFVVLLLSPPPDLSALAAHAGMLLF